MLTLNATAPSTVSTVMELSFEASTMLSPMWRVPLVSQLTPATIPSFSGTTRTTEGWAVHSRKTHR
jgi:hypothetical protein